MSERLIEEKALIHKNETTYFWIVAIISGISYLLFALSVVGLLILGGFLLVSLLFHALMIGHIRLNGVKIGPNQFPLIYNTAEDLCRKMEIKKVPDLYVMQSGGVLNAFATRFFGRNMVVIHSEIFELIQQNGEDEVHFVLAHELAHIKRNHLGKMMFILPSMWIPGVAESYLRACEYTCDRYAAYYTGNHSAAKNALSMLAIGKLLSDKVNRPEYLEQINREKGFFVWLAEVLSTHPPLPKRINEISAFFDGENQIHSNQNQLKKGILLVTMILLISGLVVGGLYYGSQFFDSASFFYEDEDFESSEEENSPLIEAVINGDLAEVKSLLDKGEDIHTIDYNGYTPLDWAIMADHAEMVELLLKNDADPNYETDYGMTPFMTAAEGSHAEMITLLFESGADPNYQESSSGYTALTYSVFSEDLQTVKLLLELGADPEIKDYSGMTARMHALQSGEKEIADLLK